MSAFKSDFLRIMSERGFVHQISDEAGLDELFRKETVTAYIGFDPTAPSLHAGGLIQIMMLHWMQKTGQRPIALMGGGTSMIGDPYFKDEARKLLTPADIDANLVGSWNVLELAKACEVRHLMLASTSSVYGANDKVPFAESDKTDEPLTLYAASKKAMEAMGHAYAHLWKIPTTAFRFFTVYGPWGRPDMALFKFVEAIETGAPIDVYGEGNMQRDFTYVGDLVEAIVRLVPVAPNEGNRVTADGIIDTLSKQGPFRIVNIGGGQPVGLLDFIAAIETALGKPAVRNLLPMQKGDVPRTYAAPDLLRELTGYVPDTNVPTGVRNFVEWYRTKRG